MNIFITGASGFVGSRLRDHFNRQGHTVSGTLHLAEQPQSGFTPLDLRQPLNPGLLSTDIDLVINCASQQPRPHLKPQDYERGNVLTLQNLLHAMTDSGVKNIIHFSSAVVYGNTEALVLTEETPVSPQNEYALSKWHAELALEEAARKHQLKAVCFRMPSVFGPGQIGGIAHTYYDHAVRNQDLEIFGGGKLLRNLLHIDDIVAACEQVSARLGTLDGYQRFLLGSRDSLSMEAIARMLVEKTRSRSHITLVARPAPFNFHWNFSIEHLAQTLGFTPMSIEEGLDRYIAQMQKMSGNV